MQDFSPSFSRSLLLDTFVCGHFVWRLFTSGHRQLIYLHSNVCVQIFCLKVVHEWASSAKINTYTVMFVCGHFVWRLFTNGHRQLKLILKQQCLCVDILTEGCFSCGHRQLIYLHSNVCVWTLCLKVVHEWASSANLFTQQCLCVDILSEGYSRVGIVS